MSLIIRDLLARILLLIYSFIPIDDRCIFFKSDRGLQCADSPLALFQEVKKNYPEYKCIWALKDTSKRLDGTVVVKEGSINEIRALATSKYWIDNKRKGCWIRKRKGQIYVQTWHGPIALKKIEKDIEKKLPKYYVKSAKHDSKMADFFLSSSAWTTEFFRKSFWYDGKILEYGSPRSDIFFKEAVVIREKVIEHYRLSQNTKILLYAPTFRDDGAIDALNIDYKRLKATLENHFGNTWKIILRLHPNIMDKQGSFYYDHDILNGNDLPDINEIIVACDMLITDYSSCMFDAVEAGKKVIIYASDIDEYKNSRDFYFSFNELPFNVAEDMDSLESAILNFNESNYYQKVQIFKDRLHLFNDGMASHKVISYIMDET